MTSTDHASCAPVRLPIGCMFEHEVGGAPIADGLGDLLTRLRAGGAFRAQPMETLLITTPPAMAPRASLVIGLGEPGQLTADLLRRATRVAMREAIRHGARSMAFAPSVLDAGHTDNAALNMPEVMLDGRLSALAAEVRLAGTGLARVDVLPHCNFDVGAPRVQAAALAFAAAFTRLNNAR